MSSDDDETGLRLRCEYLDRAAAKARDLLLGHLQKVSKEEGNYFFSDRLKGPEKILHKVRRKREEGKARLELEGETPEIQKLLGYHPDYLTDAWGCRFITLFQNEIPSTIRSLLTALTDYNREHFNELLTLREFVVYTNRPIEDPLSIAGETVDIVGRSSFAEQIKDHNTIIRPPENRKSAYSSVHFVFEKKFLGETQPNWPVLSFEVQLRDIFEEGWGQIQHRLLYSEKDVGPDSTADSKGEQHWKPHLNALKIFVDGCSQHASLIKQSYDSIRKPPIISGDKLSASPRDQDRRAILDVLKWRKAPPSALAAIDEAYRLLERAGEIE